MNYGDLTARVERQVDMAKWSVQTRTRGESTLTLLFDQMVHSVNPAALWLAYPTPRERNHFFRDALDDGLRAILGVNVPWEGLPPQQGQIVAWGLSAGLWVTRAYVFEEVAGKPEFTGPLGGLAPPEPPAWNPWHVAVWLPIEEIALAHRG